MGSCLIFIGNKFTTSGCIFQNSGGNRRSVELMEVVINKFILIPYLPLFPLVLNSGPFQRGYFLFPYLDDSCVFIEAKSSFDLFFGFRDLILSNIISLSVNNVALTFSVNSSLSLSPTRDIRALKCLI